MTKLFVIPAREAPTAVIFRRGPSAWYHVIQWDLRQDRSVHGAWFKGRIYEEKCDVSPDGRLLVYFAHQGSRLGTEFTDSWTAVSRVPWIQALIVWPQGTTYGGGGRFIDNQSIALRGVHHSPLESFPIRGIRVVDGDTRLQHPTGEEPCADWCGLDQNGEIIFTRAGRLFRRTNGLETLVADFTDLSPTPEPAPEWAGRSL